MCWNEPVSWATFILGTIFNMMLVNRFRTPTIYAMAFVIQWVLLMQLFEALAWRDQDGMGIHWCGSLNRSATHGALLANVSQPLVVFMAFMIVTSASTEAKLAASAVTLSYVLYIIYALNNAGPFDCLAPSSMCAHLDLSWWRSINPLWYCLALFSVMFLLIKPMSLAAISTGYVAITLVLSMLFYSCGAGSMWCWFATAAPALLLLFYRE